MSILERLNPDNWLLNRSFSFEKAKLNITTFGDTAAERFFNTAWQTVNDSYLISKAKEVAEKHYVTVKKYKKGDYSDRYTITVNGTKDDFVDFVCEFCEELANEIEDVTF